MPIAFKPLSSDSGQIACSVQEPWKPFSLPKRFENHIKKLSLFYPNQLLLDHQDAIAPEHNDPIHELLDDLGEVSTIESLIGELF